MASNATHTQAHLSGTITGLVAHCAIICGRRLEPHPADHGVEGNEFLNVWLVAHNGFTVCLRAAMNSL